MDILFLGKKDDDNAKKAAKYLKQIFPDTSIVFLSRGQNVNSEISWWKGDYIFSYLCPLVIPKFVLEKASKAAINWHPGPPEYPGIGCTNFAIYNGEKQFGMTCHHMNPKVDSGQIIEVRRFDVLERDTVYSITQKCYAQILNSFYDIVQKIANHEPLPVSEETWTREPYTRKQLDELSMVTSDMNKEEVERRIKATTYDNPWAFTEIHGKRFYLTDDPN